MSTKRVSSKNTNKNANKRTAARAANRATTSHSSRSRKSAKCAAPSRSLGGITIIILGVAALVVVALITVFSAIGVNRKVNPSDAEKFAAEYSSVSDDNVYKYISAADAINLIDNGTGVVYFGFPSCPWCQAYAKYLNEAAKEAGLNTVYYYNIQEDRKNNTEDYQKLVALLGADLQHDDDGNRRIYVPDVVFVVNGRIVANDLESSKDTAGESAPENYWTEARVNALKERLKSYAKQVVDAGCTDTCNS